MIIEKLSEWLAMYRDHVAPVERDDIEQRVAAVVARIDGVEAHVNRLDHTMEQWRTDHDSRP